MNKEHIETTISAPHVEALDSFFGPNQAYSDTKVASSSDSSAFLKLPVLGRHTLATHQRILVILLSGAVLGLGSIAFLTLNRAAQGAQQVSANGQALVQSQRLAKAATQAVLGHASAFVDVRESADILSKTVRGLQSGNKTLGLTPVNKKLQADVAQVLAPVIRAENNAAVLLVQETILTQAGKALRQINQQSNALLDMTQNLADIKLQQNAAPAEVAATGQLVMLTQRIGKSASEFLMLEGVSPETVFLLGKDLHTFKTIAQGLLSGDAALHLSAANNSKLREQLAALIALHEQTRIQADAVLPNLQGLLAARHAQTALVADSEALRRDLQNLQSKLSLQSKLDRRAIMLLVLMATLALLCVAGLARVQVQDSKQRQRIAEQRRQEASKQEEHAKQVTHTHQSAILRLVHELKFVAEGDLTQKATVTEDITGALADSVNYTVEGLRQLVTQVQNSATHVTQTTEQVEATSTELLAASTTQLQEIRQTGQAVLDMAKRINHVSTQAQESALVAQQSLTAADSGLQAVQDAIGGMNTLRRQIQETSRSIKQLGESSQEIGEMTELISDITEQTHVLALNAAIQAASAGEAGRGFSVVAQEIQRLAEHSADATHKITARVKAIQTDTQDAIAAMGRSTQGVVDGTRLTDSAGTALSEIDLVSRRLADLIEQISAFASKEAESANVVADNIQQIFVVTEQTSAGTQSTAEQVRELSRVAQELRQSVARFKIA